MNDSMLLSAPKQDFAFDRLAAVAAACDRIPPLWPASRFVAVNPFVGLADKPFAEAARLLERAGGRAPLLAPTFFRRAWSEGQITEEDLVSAARGRCDANELIAWLQAPAGFPSPGSPIPTVADLLDRQTPQDPGWSRFVINEISKWCGVSFDENQTTWRSPWRELGLYESWLEAATIDRNAEVYGLADFRQFARELPVDAEAGIESCLTRIGVPPELTTEFAHRQLMTVFGWASYAQFLGRGSDASTAERHALRDLLAIRLAYDAALQMAFGPVAIDWELIARRGESKAAMRRLELHAIWQIAYERGYQRELASQVSATWRPSAERVAAKRPSAQAVFCIDVRSERLRRHLESALPDCQTIGYAGFFGFAVGHQGPNADEPTPRCPALIEPTLTTGPVSAGRSQGREMARAWKAFQNSAISCFSFVEATGLAFVGALGRLASPQRSKEAKPCGCHQAEGGGLLDDAQLAPLAESALRGMGLTENFARIVLVCGHGSQSANNPQASALDCGACGGHAGDVNARVAAEVLNRPGVRDRLAAKDIAIPEDAVFVAGLHNTVTDEVALFDLKSVPDSHAGDIEALRAALRQAGARTRMERAPSLLSVEVADADRLAESLAASARDTAETRPEWGLANNAALVAARRDRTAKLRLDGRVFLHDYDYTRDPELETLQSILSAPVIVASWISLQYYACRVDFDRYGAGSKLLYNVVGGIGVLEGNSGDLKPGLSWQSIHDGERFVHEPRRLSVFVETSRFRLGEALDRAPVAKELVANDWISLFAIEGDRVFVRQSRGWSAFVPGPDLHPTVADRQLSLQGNANAPR